MDKNYHIFSDGRIERSEDTVRLETDDGEKKHIPVEHAGGDLPPARTDRLQHAANVVSQ